METYPLITTIGIIVAVILFAQLFTPKRIKTKEEIVEVVEIEEVEEKVDTRLTETYLTLENYIGQKKSIELLEGYIRKAQREKTVLPHLLLKGGGGLGKSTLAKAVAYKMGGNFIEIIPANLRNINDLYTILFLKQCECGCTSPYNMNKCYKGCGKSIKDYFYPVLRVKENDVLFLEECHGLKGEIEEFLYSLLQEGYLMVRYNGSDQPVMFPPITIAGATTQAGKLNKPFRDRFKIDIKLEPYTDEDISIIIKMYMDSKKYTYTEGGVELISSISYGVPRIAKRYVDGSCTRGEVINKESVTEFLKLRKVDDNGLEEEHRKALEFIHLRGYAGMTAIASSTGESLEDYLKVIEPALLHKKLITLGGRGRILTEKAKELYFNH